MARRQSNPGVFLPAFEEDEPNPVLVYGRAVMEKAKRYAIETTLAIPVSNTPKLLDVHPLNGKIYLGKIGWIKSEKWVLTLTKSKLSAFTRGATRLLCGGQAKASRFTTTGKGSTDKFPGDVVETMHKLLKYKLARDNGEQYSLQDDNAAFQCCPKSAGQYDVYCNFKGGVPQPGTISYGSFGTDMSSAGRSWRRLHGAPLTARDESSAESSDEEDSDADLSSD